MRNPTNSRPRALLRLLGVVALSAALAGGASACAALSSGEPRTGWDAGSSDEQIVELKITNQNFKDARIYALWDGERRRLGMVNGNTSQEFRVQWRPGATLRIEVDFVAGGGFVSSGVSTWPGEAFEFVIPAHA
jgi:hypothetical protein